MDVTVRRERVRIGIAVRLVLLVVASTLPFLFLFGLRARERSGEARQLTVDAVEGRANDVAARVDGRLREVNAALTAVGHAVRPTRASIATNDAALLDVAQMLAPLQVVINVYDSEGRNVGSSMRPAPADRVLAAERRALLARIRVSQHLEIGEPELIDADADAWGVAAGLPLRDTGGRFIGSAVAILPTDNLGVKSEVGSDERGVVVAIVDLDGHVIMQQPAGSGFVGRRFATHPLVRAALAATDSVGIVRGLDGVERFFAASGMEEAPWRVLVGSPPDAAASAGHRLLLRELAVFSTTMIIALLLAILTGRFITAPVQQLAIDARELADGKLSHRSTVRVSWELGDLADTLNQMAASLEQSRESLAAGEQRYRALFDLSPVPMWMTDRATMRFVAVNDATTRQYGWTREEFLRMTLMDVRPPETRTSFAEAVMLPPEGEFYRGRWVHWRKDASRIDIDVSIRDVVLEGRSARLSVLVDVTEEVAAAHALERSREELRQTQKMEALGRFAGGIAHDFNNLLTGIIGYAELVLPDLEAGSETRHDVDQIRLAANRAAALTQQILAFSRRQVMQPQTLALDQVIAGMGGLLQRVIGEHIRVTAISSDELWPVTADPSQLEQVIMNLALNARDAMPGGGTLDIATTNVTVGANDVLHDGVPAGQWVQLSVRDTGVGMTAEVRARLFEPFFTTKPRGKGTGLGLATAYGIVEQSGGRMRVESALGRGTTLHVYLPRSAEAESVVTAPHRAGAVEAVGGVILIAEDEPTVREVAAQSLRRLGYTVLTADSGVAALAVAEAHTAKIDLLVTDVVMPGINGPALAVQLRERRPGLPVLFMSGYADDDEVVGGIRLEGVPFLAKPFAPAELARRVREVLESATTG